VQNPPLALRQSQLDEIRENKSLYFAVRLREITRKMNKWPQLIQKKMRKLLPFENFGFKAGNLWSLGLTGASLRLQTKMPRATTGGTMERAIWGNGRLQFIEPTFRVLFVPTERSELGPKWAFTAQLAHCELTAEPVTNVSNSEH
jgi:hypothetical protein